MIAATLILAASVCVPPPEIEFRFRATAGCAPQEGVPLEITIGSPAVRADLLVDDGAGPPRWRWVDGGEPERGRIILRAPAQSRALLVFRRASATRGYDLESPFRWPTSPGPRAVQPLPGRTLRGTHPLASGAEVHLVGAAAADPLCETGPAGEWQCVASPPDFAGRVLACAGGNARAAAEVRRGSPDEVRMRDLGASAILRVAASSPARKTGPVSVRILRANVPGGVVLARDPSSEVSELEEGFFWLESRSDSADLVAELSARGLATMRVPFLELRSACEPPASVELLEGTSLTGTVREGSDRPVAGATVLVRSSDPDRDTGVLADVITDESGAFEVPDLEPRRYRLLACDARFGCGASVSAPGEPARIELDGGAAFVGRVLTSAGVPEPSARVRIVPSLDTSTRPGDRLARMPLETASGSDGRFRISVPDAGEFLVEIRSASSGAVRLPVRRSALSPPITDLGDVRLPEPLELAVRVVACGGGALSMSGPLGGETSLPTLTRFPLDGEGAAVVRLPEGGAWTAWATCGGGNVVLEPAVLADVAALATAGIEIRFEPAGALPDQPSGRSK